MPSDILVMVNMKWLPEDNKLIVISLFFWWCSSAMVAHYHCISQWLKVSGRTRRECVGEHIPCSHPAVMAAWLLCRDMKCAGGWQKEVVVTWLLRLA